jgi:L-Ala-D/L-Glu epimerase
MQPLKLTVEVEKLKLSAPFRISGYVFEDQEVVIVTLSDGRHSGRGEASGIYYLNDNAPDMVRAIESVRAKVEAGVQRAALNNLLPAGGARNALDCALWELDARRGHTTVWKLAGMAQPRPLLTTFTLGADSPEAMAQGARKWAQAKALKLKLTGDIDVDRERVKAVRAVRPDVWMGVDANQGYSIAALEPLIDCLVAAKVSLLEQPLKRGREADLDGFKSRIPIAADESVLSFAELDRIRDRFQVVNIKLDKCGGLTEGLAMAHEIRRRGLKVMVGNMVGSSLAMAPAFVLGQLCDVVDLDGPIFLAKDRTPAITYTDGLVWSGDEVWGAAQPDAA